MARLIRTEKEVEGRYEEVWTVVEEDALDQWPAGPLDVVGRPALRQDGLQRARGEARYTADVALPGMLHAAVLRSPHARRARARSTSAPALALPGVHDGDLVPRGRRPQGGGAATRAPPSPPWPPTRSSRRRLRWRRSPSSGRRSSRCSTPTRRSRAVAAARGAEPLRARRPRRRARDGGRGRRGRVPHGESVLHNSIETHQAVCEWRATRSTSTSRRSTSGASAPAWRTRSGSRPTASACLRVHGRRLRREERRRRLHARSRPSWPPHRPARAVRAQPPRGEPRRRATATRPSSGCASAPARTARSSALGGEFVNAVGWGGWVSGTDGPMQMLYACENVATTLHGAKLNSGPDGRVPRARVRRGDVRARVPARRARREARHSTRSSCGGATTRTPTCSTARPFSSKNLLECYRRAEQHWERRDEVRARSTGPWKHGVGLASQVWYGGGGPPSYAWVRVGSDARATVVTAMQDIGTGSRTAMAQIAAEELGLPLDQVTVELGDSARGPYATLSAGSSTIPSMGPAVRAAAGDAARADPRARRAALAPRGCARCR